MRTIDLFAGIGGIRLAFEQAGFSTAFANDYEQKCADTYNLNFRDPKLTVDDIRKINHKELPEFDFLLGGFPCQPFSIAGLRKGMEDDRGTLFLEIAKIIDTKRPTGFFLENVKNLRCHDSGKTFKKILNTFDKLEYDIKFTTLNSCEYSNVPQNRERIYIVGFSSDTKLIKDFQFPSKTPLVKNVLDILTQEVRDKYYYNNTPLFEKIKNHPFTENRVYQWRRKYMRENKAGLCPTLTANMGTGGHNVPIIKDKKGIRKLTPRECARLQGFDESFKLPDIADSHLYKQIGNSVSVPVVKEIAKNIISIV